MNRPNCIKFENFLNVQNRSYKVFKYAATEDGDIFTLDELLEEEFFESKKEVEENCTKIPKGTYYITI